MPTSSEAKTTIIRSSSPGEWWSSLPRMSAWLSRRHWSLPTRSSALAKKDRSAYDAYMEALSDVKKYGNLPVPLQIRNAPTNLMKELGYGKGYEKYPKESLLPEKIKSKKYLRKKQEP